MLLRVHLLSNSRKEIDGVGQRVHMPSFSTMLSSSAIIGLKGTSIKVYRWDPLNNLCNCTFLLSQVLGVFRK